MKNLFIAFVCLLLTATTINASTLDASPTRLTFNGDGNLLVSDYIYGQILVVNKALDIINAINVNGRPISVAWHDGYTIVGNTTTNQVEAYDIYGYQQFIFGYGNYPIDMPQDMEIGFGSLYVVDGSAKNVKVFNLDGTFSHAFGEFTNPTGIAIDEVNETIFISDYGDLGNGIYPSVRAYGLDGGYKFRVRAGKLNKFAFSMPQGMTVVNGHLYLVDALMGYLHIFDPVTGNLVGKVKGSGDISTKLPLDVVSDGLQLYVTNNMKSSIKIFGSVR